jgi:uncharacterized protein YxjI
MASPSSAWHGGGVSIDRASSLPPPPVAPAPAGPTGKKPGRRGRPAFGKVIIAVVGLRAFREVVEWVAVSKWGAVGAVLVGLAVIGVVLGWRAHQRRKVTRRGGVQHTPEEVTKQLQDSELLPPAFAENGTIAGASILVLNQLPKVLEVETQYEVFGSDAQRIGTLRQIGQSRGKQLARVLTTFDQFFTHHFELEDLDGEDVLRMTRPRKVFKSRLRVFDGQDRFLGQWVQQNVFWKIRWTLLDAAGRPVAHMKAANLRAWDFHVEVGGREAATIVKSWEGWARTAWTRADRYVIRINEQHERDLRLLLLATPLVIDQSLKQDARGFG